MIIQIDLLHFLHFGLAIVTLYGVVGALLALYYLFSRSIGEAANGWAWLLMLVTGAPLVLDVNKAPAWRTALHVAVCWGMGLMLISAAMLQSPRDNSHFSA